MSDCEIPQAAQDAPPVNPDNPVPSERHLQVVSGGPGTLLTLRRRGHRYNNYSWRTGGDTPPPAA